MDVGDALEGVTISEFEAGFRSAIDGAGNVAFQALSPIDGQVVFAVPDFVSPLLEILLGGGPSQAAGEPAANENGDLVFAARWCVGPPPCTRRWLFDDAGLVLADEFFLDGYTVRFLDRPALNEVGDVAFVGQSDERIPSVAACDAADQHLVAWQSDQDTGGSDWAIYGRFVSGAGVPGNKSLIDDTTAPETAVDMSCDTAGEQYLLAWQTRYATSAEGGWGRRVHPDETMEPAFLIVQPDTNRDRTEPAVGGGAANYLVAWEQDTVFIPNRDIWGLLVPIPEPSAGFAAMMAVATLGTVLRAKRRGSAR